MMKIKIDYYPIDSNFQIILKNLVYPMHKSNDVNLILNTEICLIFNGKSNRSQIHILESGIISVTFPIFESGWIVSFNTAINDLISLLTSLKISEYYEISSPSFISIDKENLESLFWGIRNKIQEVCSKMFRLETRIRILSYHRLLVTFT